MVNGQCVPVTLEAKDCPPLEDQVDAVLYLGPSDKTVDAAPELYRDEVYVAELRRRAAILLPVLGWDENPEIDKLVEAAKKHPHSTK